MDSQLSIQSLLLLAYIVVLARRSVPSAFRQLRSMMSIVDALCARDIVVQVSLGRTL